jgi:putative transposase
MQKSSSKKIHGKATESLLGWRYLAAVLDLYSRKIVGWSISNKPDSQLTVNALKDALANRTYRKRRLMFHSNQGSQYTSKGMREYLRNNGILQSMSRRGQYRDNAAIKNFFGTQLETGIGKWPLDTAEETRFVVFDWIECWYNIKRRRHNCPLFCDRSLNTISLRLDMIFLASLFCLNYDY